MAAAARALRIEGHNPLLTREPGGSRLGRHLRAILLDLESRDLNERSELFLYLADRAQHVAEVIAPALAGGRLVLSDRFVDSTVAYQGYGRGLDPRLLHTLNDMAVDGRWPDLTLLFDLPAEIGLKRALTRDLRLDKRGAEGRFEAEELAFHERVREGYLSWAALHKHRFRIVDAARPPEEVASEAIGLIRAARLSGKLTLHWTFPRRRSTRSARAGG